VRRRVVFLPNAGERSERDLKDVCIIGVDIQPGSSPFSASGAKYSVVVLKNNTIRQEFRDATIGKIVRLAWECGSANIAVDNIYELAPDKKTLIKLFEMFPESTEIIQVTAGEGGFRDLDELKRILGLEHENTSDPLSSARIIAYAASKGIGLRIKRKVVKTKIIVTRGRSVSHGGMSYNRYMRSIRAGILSVTKDIKKILDENKIDYDLYMRKSKGGLERSVFIVYATREELYGIVKPVRTKGVKVVVKPVSDILMGNELKERSSRPIIVGIDPGMTTGIALVDLDGRVIHASSYRSVDRSIILNIISQHGIPIAVATDVSQAPELVEKMAAQTGAILVTPPRDLDSNEKQKLVEKALSLNKGLYLKDSHVKDALASAFKALNMFSDKILEINRFVRRYNLREKLPFIVREVLSGRPVNEVVEKYINLEISGAKTASPVVEDWSHRRGHDSSDIQTLRQRVVELEAAIQFLQKQLADKDELIKNLELELRLSRNLKWSEECERKVYVLTNELNELRRSLEEKDRRIEDLLNKVNHLALAFKGVADGSLLVIPRLKRPSDILGISSTRVKIVFLDEALVLDDKVTGYLKSNKTIVLTRRKPLTERPVVILEYQPVVEFEEFVVVERKILEEGERMWAELERKEREEEFNRVVKMIEEYQAQRMKKLGVNSFDRSI
jgi:predicted RNase H-like nuclease (RuvC/YqgF family)